MCSFSAPGIVLRCHPQLQDALSCFVFSAVNSDHCLNVTESMLKMFSIMAVYFLAYTLRNNKCVSSVCLDTLKMNPSKGASQCSVDVCFGIFLTNVWNKTVIVFNVLSFYVREELSQSHIKTTSPHPDLSN